MHTRIPWFDVGFREARLFPDGERVLHFIDTVGPGGAETIFLQVAAGMRDRGWSGRVVLVGPGWVEDRVRELGLPVDVVTTSGRWDFRYLARLAGLVRRHRIELIHAHLFSPALYASVIGAGFDVPVVATMHGASDVEPHGRAWRGRYALIGRRARVVCVSRSLSDQLVSAGAMTAEEPLVIHNGVDVAAFSRGDGEAVRREHGLDRDTILVGAMGNMRAAKDFPTMLRAAALLAPDRRLAFAIAGEPAEPLFGELRALRDELGLADRVSFWGFRSDPAAVMAAYDVLVVSSSSEGFSLAVVQAMAAGTPVVATRSGGPEEIVTDGVDGVLVPPSSPEALAAGVRRVLDDDAFRARMVGEARATAARRFSVDAMIDRYEELYTELVGEPAVPRIPISR